jgi:hypothetical protein
VERRRDVGAGDPARGRGPQKKGLDAGEPADHGLGRCRGGFGGKLHVATDGRGNVLQVVLTKGNRNEIPVLGPLLASAVAAAGGRGGWRPTGGTAPTGCGPGCGRAGSSR